MTGRPILAASLFWLAASAAQAPEPFRVVLDPGHGGPDEGARAGELAEKDLALDVARRLQARYSSRPDLEVVLTRSHDAAVSFDERRRIANASRADLYLSLHFSPAADPSAPGARVFFLAPPAARPEGLLTPLESAHAAAAPLSDLLSAHLLDAFESESLPARSVATALALAPLLGIRAPAVLVELELPAGEAPSAPAEGDRRERFAALLAQAIDRFRSEGKNPWR